jgi:hypothetical protein
VNALEVYITEVERELDRKVKIIRSNRGGEYYGKYDETGQCPGPFVKSLKRMAYVHSILCLECHSRMV